MIKDINGVEIKVGQSVTVHQDEGPRQAMVAEVLDPACPTVNEPGFWVDIDDGSGLEEMMSYILVVNP